MRTEEFNNSREFLETQIKKNPNNKEYLEAYTKLLELKSAYDTNIDKELIAQEIKNTEIFTEHNSVIHTNNTKYNIALHTNNTNFNIATSQNSTDYWINSNNNFNASYQSTLPYIKPNLLEN